MYRLTLLFSALIVFNASAMIEKIPDHSLKTIEELKLEKILFESTDEFASEQYDLTSIEVIEIEEAIEINFDTKAHLPANFNALQGMHDLDWNTIELIELNEKLELGFDPQAYLPEGFNALKGKHDLDWNTIELVEVEEEIELGFDTKQYLPKEFSPYKGLDCKKEVVVCLY